MALSILNSFLKKKIDVSKKDTAVVGVDIGSSAIKIVQLRDKNGVATLETYGELQLGPYEGVEIGRQTRLRVDKLTEAFVDILREAAASARKVSIAISYNSSFNTIVTMPTDDSQRITEMIPIEARKYVPVPLSDVTLDWFPVSTHSAEAKTTKVLLAAIHNEALSRYEVMVKGVELGIHYMEIELFSTIRSVVAQEDETVAIIDLGASSTKLYLVHKGIVGKTHSISMDGVELTQEISNLLKIDFRQAEEYKRTIGIKDPDAPLSRALTTILGKGFHEIQKMITLYEAEDARTVSKVILTGGGALLQGLVPYMRDVFSKEILLADPFAKVAYPAFLEDTLRDAGPSFAAAVGVALNNLTE